MAVVDADYTAVIGYMRNHLRDGTRPNQAEIQKTLAVVQDAISRFAVAGTVTDIVASAALVEADLNTALTGLNALVVEHLAILQAKTTNDASAEIDAADTALTTAIGLLTTSNTTLQADVVAAAAANPTVPTYQADAVADGVSVY